MFRVIGSEKVAPGVVVHVFVHDPDSQPHELIVTVACESARADPEVKVIWLPNSETWFASNPTLGRFGGCGEFVES